MNYEHIMESCIELIFKSGMLLNEHDELLVQFWRPIPLQNHNCIKMYTIDATLLCGFVVGTYKRNFILQTTSVLSIAIRLYGIIHKKIKSRYYRRQFSKLINNLQDIFGLLKKMLQQYRSRKANIDKLSLNTKKAIEHVISDHMLSLLISTGEIVFDLVISSNNVLKQIGNIVDIGDLNFVFVIDIDEGTFKFNNSTEESILNSYDKVYMLYIYVISSLFCGLGLTFCKSQWESRALNFPKLFSSILPTYLQYTTHVHQKVIQNFHLMCNTSSKNHIEVANKRNVDRPLLSSVNSLREQIELSLHVVTAMQQQLCCGKNDNLLIVNYITDIEDLLSRCNDVLNIVRYNSDRIFPTIGKGALAIVPETHTVQDAEEDGNEAILSELGNLPVFYEEFNLSIHGSDLSDNEDRSHLEYDQLLEYAKIQQLMIRELNNELRKRNYIKQDIAPVPAKHTRVINKSETNSTFGQSNEASTDAINTSKQPISNDFLAQIRAAASNRGCEESIFGDDAVSSSSIDEENDE